MILRWDCPRCGETITSPSASGFRSGNCCWCEVASWSEGQRRHALAVLLKKEARGELAPVEVDLLNALRRANERPPDAEKRAASEPGS
jgi:hypothetical protein